MEWLNEPASWQRTGDVLTVSVDPGTDFWRETGYGYIRDSGHVYGDVLGGDLDVSVRLRCTLGVQYDQAGVMLRADERTWLKTGVEFFEGRARLSTVLTLGRSSWMVTDLPEGTDDLGLRVSRRGDAVEVRYVVKDGPAELAALVFLPPGREVLAGVMAAAPEGPGFRVTFHDLRITARDWSAAGDSSWQDDQAAWASGEAPAWSPADGEPGWAEPELEEDVPDWPATEAEAVAPGWPVPPAGDQDAPRQGPAGEEGEPGWAAGTAAEGPGWPAAGGGDEEPGWAAGTAAEGPGWPAAGAVGEEPGWAHVAEDRDGTERATGADAGRGDAPEKEPGAPGPADGPAEPGPAPPGPGGQVPAGEEDSGHGQWPSARATGHGAWAGPAGRSTPAVVDPAADWERLAAGTQAAGAQAAGAGAAGEQAARWSARRGAELAGEWPGPPRTAMRNGPLGSDAAPRHVAGDAADDAQTDPGLPRPRTADQAEAGPGQPEAATGPAAAGAEGAEAASAQAESSAADQGEPAPPDREPRRSRFKRAAADQPTQPDAADEWISLLTADPAEE